MAFDKKLMRLNIFTLELYEVETDCTLLTNGSLLSMAIPRQICVLCALNYVRQNVAVVLLLLSSIIPVREFCLCDSVWYYADFDSIIRVSNYVLLNPGLQRARPLWSGASEPRAQFFPIRTSRPANNIYIVFRGNCSC